MVVQRILAEYYGCEVNEEAVVALPTQSEKQAWLDNEYRKLLCPMVGATFENKLNNITVNAVKF